MSYLLDKTNNSSSKIVVEDGTIDNTSTALTMIGKAYAGWGEVVNENFLALLENFASTSSPRNAITGQLWYDTSTARLKYFDGVTYNTLANFPAPTEGFLYNSSSNITSWVPGADLAGSITGSIFPSGAPSGVNSYLQKTTTGALTWVSGTSLFTDALPSGNGFLTKNADGTYSLTSTSTIATQNDLTNLGAAAAFPKGGIIMWSGTVAAIPKGWALCDGQNGTPNLRDRFVVGAGSGTGATYNVGNTGGSADAVVVSHTHTVTDPKHHHDVFSGSGVGAPNYPTNIEGDGNPNVGTAAPTGDSVTGITIASAGVSGTNANLPPYYALAFIMKT
jgi:microcystin-dependent protein